MLVSLAAQYPAELSYLSQLVVLKYGEIPEEVNLDVIVSMILTTSAELNSLHVLYKGQADYLSIHPDAANERLKLRIPAAHSVVGDVLGNDFQPFDVPRVHYSPKDNYDSSKVALFDAEGNVLQEAELHDNSIEPISHLVYLGTKKERGIEQKVTEFGRIEIPVEQGTRFLQLAYKSREGVERILYDGFIKFDTPLRLLEEFKQYFESHLDEPIEDFDFFSRGESGFGVNITTP